MVKYSVSSSTHQESFSKAYFLYLAFISRTLSAGIFLETEVSLSADTLFAESIICALCISGKRGKWPVAKSVDAPEESRLLRPVKRLMLCLLEKQADC